MSITTARFLKAEELQLGHVGRTVRSLVYPNKNKTAKPRGSYRGRHDGIPMYMDEPREYTIASIYVHENGNILINSDYYLHMDTRLEVLD